MAEEGVGITTGVADRGAENDAIMAAVYTDETASASGSYSVSIGSMENGTGRTADLDAMKVNTQTNATVSSVHRWVSCAHQRKIQK